MNKFHNYILEIRNFDFNEYLVNKGTTQGESKIFEDFVEKCTKEKFVNSIIMKNGSQSHPDFLLINKDDYEQVLIDMKNNKIKTKPLNYIKKNYSKYKFILIEVKSKKGEHYNLNDTFPSINKFENTVYIMFDRRNNKVYITTSNYMAINHRYVKFQEIKSIFDKINDLVHKLRHEKKEMWPKEMGIWSFPRANYFMNKFYAHNDIPVEELEKLFNEHNIY